MMYCMKKNILIFTLLLLILKFTYSHKVIKAENVTTDRVKRAIFRIPNQSYNPHYEPAIVTVLNLLIQKAFYNKPEYINVELKTELAFCKINIKKLHFNHSILISPQGYEQFHYPNDDGDIVVLKETKLFLSCPGHVNYFANYSDYRFISVTCVSGIVFKDPNGKEVDFDTTRYVCLQTPESTFRLLKNKLEYERSKLYEIGFYVGKDEKFLRLMLINYDKRYNTTRYVISDISKWLAGSQKPPGNHRYDQCYYCPNINMDEAYKADVQNNSFENQLKCQHDGTCHYFDASKERYFDRSHLTPKSSFVYTAAGVATFKYLNTSPQWKVIKYQNWLLIEKHIATMATTLKEDLRTITGVISALSYNDISDANKRKLIHLYFTENERAVYVPLFFYKLVYLVKGERGVVYVTVNDPDMALQVPHLYQVCLKPMFQIKGGKSPSQWSPTHRDKGYSYICEVHDFLVYNGLEFNDPILRTVKHLLYIPTGDTTTLTTTIKPWQAMRDELKK